MPRLSSRRSWARVTSLLVVGLLFFQLVLCDQAHFELEVGSPDTVEYEHELLGAAQNASLMKSCASCQALVFSFKRLASLGDDAFVSALTNTCKSRKLQDPDICEGDVGAQGPIIAYALRRMSVSGRTSRLFCNAVFGLCDPEPVEPYDFPLPSPKLEIANTPANPLRRRNPFKVIHLSDVHIDRFYTIGSEANCTKYICCRNFESNADDKVAVPAEPFGNRRCDSPIRLANSMLRGIRDHVPDALFTISTGDVVDHFNWLLTQDIVENELHGFHEQLFMNLSESNSFYGSLGNHDSYPTNDFPRTTSEDPNKAKWVFDLLSADWHRWIGTDGASQVRHNSGSFAVVHPGTKLKVISLNTLFWYKFNFYLYDSNDFQPDPNGLLSFLASELDAAEKAGQRAWIFGHVPPGNGDAMRDQSNYLNQIVKRYQKTIAGQFYGHTHHDEFQIAYTDYSNQTAENAMSFGLVAPSLTPTNGNPAFTVYDVDPDTYDIMDKKVYIANMSLSKYHTQPKWELYYSARETYGPLVAALMDANNTQLPPDAPLDAPFWHRLTDVFLADNKTFGQFNARKTRKPVDLPARGCGEACKNNTICALRAMRAEDSCYTHTLRDIVIGIPPFPPLSTNESDTEFSEYAAHGECEGSAFPSMMRKLVE